MFSRPKLFYLQKGGILFLIGLGLSIFGLLMIYDASAVSAYENFADPYHFLKRQLIWLFISLAASLVCSRINYSFWLRLARPLALLSLFFLIIVLIPGWSSQIYGARRWLSLPFPLPFLGEFRFQPSELAKISLVFLLAAGLKNYPPRSPHRARFLFILLLWGIFGGLIILQPDFGSAFILISASLILLFSAGLPWREIILLLLILLIGGGAFIFSSGYRRQRVLTFLQPQTDRQKSSYHINQILIALGSGGLWGRGLGYSRQKYQYLPEVSTDSIFAVIGEEFGFIGSLSITLVLALLIHYAFQLSRRTSDPTALYLSSGLTALLALPTILNLGSMVALIPLTGDPLPFISYGGSSLLANWIILGILINIARQNNEGPRKKRIKR